MPAEEETRGTAVGESRARSGPRHALPRKPLLTRLQVPAGKAIAVAAMPTAVLMGMGFTPTLARAEDKPSSKNLTVDEYKDCVDALEAAEEAEEEASASPSPSTSTSEAASDGKEEQSTSGGGSSGDGSSSDSGSDDKPEPEPSTSASAPADPSEEAPSTETPTPSESSGNVLDQIGDAIKDVFTPDDPETGDTTATPSATPSASAGEDTSGAVGDTEDKAADTAEDAKDTAEKSVKDTAKAVNDAAEDTAERADEAVGDATESASPSPSESAGVDADDCPAATDDESGVEKGIPLLPDDPWYLEASSLTLNGADYKGIVKVRTASGKVKKVLKYVISDGSQIVDLHQIVKDKQAGKTYHVQSAKGEKSTITGGKTVMYTERISGNLLGFVPVTFDPEHPPPLNISWIFFTNAKVTQAAQFGGTLTIPGMRQYTTD